MSDAHNEPDDRLEYSPDEVKELREALGLSVRDLAWLLAVDERRLRRYERGDGSLHPLAHIVMSWFAAGFRPPEWPE